MTRRQNARLAGSCLLLYILIGILQSVIGSGASAGGDALHRLASMWTHAVPVKVNALLGLATAFTALALAAAMYGLTRDEDPDLSLLALSCRVAEGILGAVPTIASLSLLSLAATNSGMPGIAGTASALFRVRSLATLVGSIFFAVGSSIFAWLLLRNRFIPRPLAVLGVVSSLILAVALPLQLAELLTAPLTSLIWAPMAAFEIPLGIWLLLARVGPPLAGSGAPD